MYGGGSIFDGEESEREYFAITRAPLPDQSNEIISIAAVR